VNLVWILIFYLGGITLIFSELMLPGAILGILGAAGVIASAVLVGMEYPEHAFFIIAAQVVGVVGAVALGFKLLPHSPFTKGMILSESGGEWVSNTSDDKLVGLEGEVYSPLRPAGKVLLEGKRVDAVSSGSLIEKGARVRVTEVHGNRVVVEEVFEPDADEG
jgi:membrane-bound serine protease (ClpP class)